MALQLAEDEQNFHSAGVSYNKIFSVHTEK
jgi:hypothetical protein